MQTAADTIFSINLWIYTDSKFKNRHTSDARTTLMAKYTK